MCLGACAEEPVLTMFRGCGGGNALVAGGMPREAPAGCRAAVPAGWMAAVQYLSSMGMHCSLLNMNTRLSLALSNTETRHTTKRVWGLTCF